MRIIAAALLAVSVFAAPAVAANPLTAGQLLQAIQGSAADYAKEEPDMSASISGFRVATAGGNAQVTIEMKADGMNMSAKYMCVAQGASMACRQQQ